MSNTLIITWFLFLVLLVPQEETIIWHSQKQLTWNDFKGTPYPKSKAVAITVAGISFKYSVKELNSKISSFNPEVKAVFYPEKSWVFKDKTNHFILEHEQLHFDIVELYVRKFRKQLKEITLSSNYKNELKNLQNTINKELESIQNQYDNDTQNSINQVRQLYWNNYIKIELKKYQTYKSLNP